MPTPTSPFTAAQLARFTGPVVLTAGALLSAVMVSTTPPASTHAAVAQPTPTGDAPQTTAPSIIRVSAMPSWEYRQRTSRPALARINPTPPVPAGHTEPQPVVTPSEPIIEAAALSHPAPQPTTAQQMAAMIIASVGETPLGDPIAEAAAMAEERDLQNVIAPRRREAVTTTPRTDPSQPELTDEDLAALAELAELVESSLGEPWDGDTEAQQAEGSFYPYLSPLH